MKTVICTIFLYILAWIIVWAFLNSPSPVLMAHGIFGLLFSLYCVCCLVTRRIQLLGK